MENSLGGSKETVMRVYILLLVREDREPHIRKRPHFLIKENELVPNHRISRKAVAKLVFNSISSLCSSSQSEKVLKYNFLDLRK